MQYQQVGVGVAAGGCGVGVVMGGAGWRRMCSISRCGMLWEGLGRMHVLRREDCRLYYYTAAIVSLNPHNGNTILCAVSERRAVWLGDVAGQWSEEV